VGENLEPMSAQGPVALVHRISSEIKFNLHILHIEGLVQNYCNLLYKIR